MTAFFGQTDPLCGQPGDNGQSPAAYVIADVWDMIGDYFEAGPPEPPDGGAA